MMFEPLADALQTRARAWGREARVLYLSPQGRRLDQARCRHSPTRER